MKKVVIIGAGLVGSLCAIYLARRGYEVSLFESRKDPRYDNQDVGRSINLAMSCRGLTSLKAVDLEQEVKKLMVPMKARAIHKENGDVIYQPFGRDEDEHINAIQRTDLNNLLINTAESFPSITLFFETKIKDIDFKTKQLTIVKKNAEEITFQYPFLIAADGAHSYVRECLEKNKVVTASRDFLPYGYKELSICEKKDGHFAKEHLHLWPRVSYLLLGNPNLDGSITGSLFMAKEGENSFAKLNDEEKIHDFFKINFKDAYECMPHLMDEMLKHPIGNMSTIHCSPWSYDNCLLIGDAAHGIVPFFGQGMNCGFEDCRILNQLLDDHDENWSLVLPQFYASRKKNTEAVAKMSMDNYHEIHEDIRNESFILKKKIELELMTRFPSSYQSKHVLVMFTNTSYAAAEAIGQCQQKLLTQILQGKNTWSEIDWNEAKPWIKSYEKEVSGIL